MGCRDRWLHHVLVALRAAFKLSERLLGCALVALGLPDFQGRSLIGVDLRVDRQDCIVEVFGERRGRALDILVDANDDLVTGFDGAKASRVRLDELLLDVATLDRFDCAAPAEDLLHFGPCRLDELLRACLDDLAALE